MLQRVIPPPRRILMTVDAVGGVWQYALALTERLVLSGCKVVLAGSGPPPGPEQKRQAEALATLAWLRTPPEWMANSEAELDGLRGELSRLVRDHAIDIVHLNEPAQAVGLDLPCPIVAVSHSCIATWFRAVRGARPPAEWSWHEDRTRAGLKSADVVVAPSKSHAAAVAVCYGAVPSMIVVHNAVAPAARPIRRDDIVFAAGRWWDDGKNGRVLDLAAARTAWPVFAAGATTGPNGDKIMFKNVTALGSLAHSEARALAGRCGVFVSPSVYEPFGLAALEAATAGTPLLLADIPTYRELWSDAAIFFSPHDPDGLADEINLLTADEPLRRKLGVAARRRSRSYTRTRQATAMHEVYEQATSIRAGRC